jgi:hypothetical protein
MWKCISSELRQGQEFMFKACDKTAGTPSNASLQAALSAHAPNQWRSSMTPRHCLQSLTTALLGAGLLLPILTGCDRHSESAHQDPAHAHAEQANHHGHDSPAGSAGLKLNAGAKWSIDAPLQNGMQRIHRMVEATSANKTLIPERAIATSNGVMQEVEYLIANCKLSAEADAVLHVLIAELLAGAEALAKPESSAHGLDQIRQALAQYPRYFDHPDWPSAKTEVESNK